MNPQSLIAVSDLITVPQTQIRLLSWLVRDVIFYQDFQTKENYIARRALKKLVDRWQRN